MLPPQRRRGTLRLWRAPRPARGATRRSSSHGCAARLALRALLTRLHEQGIYKRYTSDMRGALADLAQVRGSGNGRAV